MDQVILRGYIGKRTVLASDVSSLTPEQVGLEVNKLRDQGIETSLKHQKGHTLNFLPPENYLPMVIVGREC